MGIDVLIFFPFILLALGGLEFIFLVLLITYRAKYSVAKTPENKKNLRVALIVWLIITVLLVVSIIIYVGTISEIQRVFKENKTKSISSSSAALLYLSCLR